jgi:5-methylcytosine-specific restriction endonuclease McrA
MAVGVEFHPDIASLCLQLRARRWTIASIASLLMISYSTADRMARPERRKREQTGQRTAYWDDPEAARERCRKSTAAYRTRHPGVDRGRYWANLEHSRAVHREKQMRYYYSPRGQATIRQIEAARRAGTRGGRVTAQQLRDLHAAQEGRCKYCVVVMDMSHPRNKPQSCTIDHVLPLTKDGIHDISNIVLACKSCNSRKGNKVI